MPKKARVSLSKATRPTRREAYIRLAMMAKELPDVVKIVVMIQFRAMGLRGIRDSVHCPRCKKGRVQYVISKSNGHVHGKCTTPGCVAFMQ